MNSTTNTRALDLIESAVRSTPYCACGEPTDAIAREGEIWLECVTLREEKGIVRRLLSLDFVGHVSRPIVDDPAFTLAA
jgi:hypothetical protein